MPRRTLSLTLLLFAAFSLSVAAAVAGQSAPPVRTGEELFETACAACHGTAGRGAPPHPVGFDLPLPDFTECSFSTVEPDGDWLAVAHEGGPVRAFSRRMPAFGGALSVEEIQRALDHMRSFCADSGWPRGELNLPRALITEKAFPENEFVLTTSVATSGSGEVSTELLYEKRLGRRGQLEVAVPLDLSQGEDGPWVRGLGDTALAFKYAAFHSFRRGSIFSVVGEVVLPTGKESLGLGKGVTVFEPFVAFGQILPADSFLQVQAGAELPADTDKADQEIFFRTAVGKTFAQGPLGFGRAWSPMVELLAARELADGAPVEWDIVPEMQITLNRRQHIMVNLGYRTPLSHRAGRGSQFIAYFLWDWFDGGLLDGWR